MSIVLIKGAKQSGKSLIANALRNNQISSGNGALLIDETNDGELKPLIEKLLNGSQLPDEIPADWAKSLPWKKSPMIIFVGDKADMLKEIEAVLPEFSKVFAPIYTIDTGISTL